MQRKLQRILKKSGALDSKTALTLEEVKNIWPKTGIKTLRNYVIERQLKFGVIRGKVKKTDEDKYYLNVGK